MTKIFTSLGTNLRKARIKAALTQKELSEKSGISARFISGVERGHLNPSVSSLSKIAKVLGIQAASLVDF